MKWSHYFALGSLYWTYWTKSIKCHRKNILVQRLIFVLSSSNAAPEDLIEIRTGFSSITINKTKRNFFSLNSRIEHVDLFH